MNRILLLAILLLSFMGVKAQYVYTIKADSVRITNSCDSAELIIQNHTQGVSGYLFNTGNGRTVFQKVLQKINDSTYLVGVDTLKIVPVGNAVMLNPTTAQNGNVSIVGTMSVQGMIDATNNVNISNGGFLYVGGSFLTPQLSAAPGMFTDSLWVGPSYGATTPAFEVHPSGIATYTSDYGSLFTSRTLVDKGYVDSSEHTITPTLANVLTNGNTANTSIIMPNTVPILFTNVQGTSNVDSLYLDNTNHFRAGNSALTWDSVGNVSVKDSLTVLSGRIISDNLYGITNSGGRVNYLGYSPSNLLYMNAGQFIINGGALNMTAPGSVAWIPISTMGVGVSATNGSTQSGSPFTGGQSSMVYTHNGGTGNVGFPESLTTSVGSSVSFHTGSSDSLSGLDGVFHWEANGGTLWWTTGKTLTGWGQTYKPWQQVMTDSSMQRYAAMLNGGWNAEGTWPINTLGYSMNTYSKIDHSVDKPDASRTTLAHIYYGYLPAQPACSGCTEDGSCSNTSFGVTLQYGNPTSGPALSVIQTSRLDSAYLFRLDSGQSCSEKRVEYFYANSMQPVGTDSAMWFGATFTIPQTDTNQMLIVQNHGGPGDSNSPMFGLQVVGTRLQASLLWDTVYAPSSNSGVMGTTIGLGMIKPNVPFSVVIRDSMIAYPNKGRLQIWINGELALNWIGYTNFVGENQPLWHTGIYKAELENSQCPTCIATTLLEVQDIRMGNDNSTYADIVPTHHLNWDTVAYGANLWATNYIKEDAPPVNANPTSDYALLWNPGDSLFERATLANLTAAIGVPSMPVNGNTRFLYDSANRLASTGTLSINNTTNAITQTAGNPSAWSFSGSYTTTANNQNDVSLSPTVTLRGTSGDTSIGLLLAPSFTIGATNQTVDALVINPTITPGTYASITNNALEINGNMTFMQPTTWNIGTNSFPAKHVFGQYINAQELEGYATTGITIANNGAIPVGQLYNTGDWVFANAGIGSVAPDSSSALIALYGNGAKGIKMPTMTRYQWTTLLSDTGAAAPTDGLMVVAGGKVLLHSAGAGNLTLADTAWTDARYVQQTAPSGVPTMTIGSAAGSGSTYSITALDSKRMVVTIATSASGQTTGSLFTINFPNSWASTPIPVWSWNSSGTIPVSVGCGMKTNSLSQIEFDVTSSALLPNTTYVINISVDY